MIRHGIKVLLAALLLASGTVHAQLYSKFGPVTGVLKGNVASPQTSAAAASDLTSLFSCVADTSHFLNGAGTCTVPAGTGVTSVALTAPSWYTVTGSPVTSTGTLAITAATGQAANRVIASPDGTTGAVSLRALVAGDIPPINLGSTANGGVSSATILLGTNGGTSNGFFSVTGPATSLKTFTFPNASATVLTSNAAVTVAQGGTGVATLTNHGVLLGQGTSNVSAVAAMAADTLLQGQGTGADPAAVAINNCGSSTTALSYSTSTHAFGCQTISAGGTGTVTSVGSGTGITASPNPIVGTGTLAIDQTFTPTWTALHTYSLAWSSGTTGTELFSSATPFLDWNVTGGGTNQKRWVLYGTGSGTTTFAIDSWNDASTSGNHGLVFTRGTGVAIATIDIGNGSDVPAINGNGVVMTPVTGTYTATFNGFTAGLTRTGAYYKIGNMFCTTIPSGTGTSNATSFTITGLPAAATPTSQVGSGVGEVEDNGTNKLAYWRIPSGGTTLTFSNGTNGTAFTGSGTKGIDDNFTGCWITN